MNKPIITANAASKQGMRPLTKPYGNSPSERKMLDAVLSDMGMGGGFKFAPVKADRGIEVWRSNMLRIVGGIERIG